MNLASKLSPRKETPWWRKVRLGNIGRSKSSRLASVYFEYEVLASILAASHKQEKEEGFLFEDSENELPKCHHDNFRISIPVSFSGL